MLAPAVLQLVPPCPPPPAPAEAPAATIERLRGALGADRVTLVRIEAWAATFELVATTGRPLLAGGAQLPVESSSLVTAAVRGVHGRVTPSHAPRVLDRLLLAAGTREARSWPIVADGAAAGAVAACWLGPPPPVPETPEYVLEAVEALRGAVAAAPRRRSARVLVCHEQRLVGETLAAHAASALGLRAVAVSSLAELQATLPLGLPDLVLWSERLCPETSLASAVGRLRAAGVAAPVLVLAREDTPESLAAAARAGAAGFAAASLPLHRLSETIQAMLGGRFVLPDPGPDAPETRLTDREQEVLRSFARGLSAKQVARELGVADSTVKTHARNIFRKLEVTSRTAALHRAGSVGLL